MYVSNYQYLDINECHQNPCKAGKCVNHNGDYSCECQKGFTGVDCNEGSKCICYVSALWIGFLTQTSSLLQTNEDIRHQI